MKKHLKCLNRHLSLSSSARNTPPERLDVPRSIFWTLGEVHPPGPSAKIKQESCLLQRSWKKLPPLDARHRCARTGNRSERGHDLARTGGSGLTIGNQTGCLGGVARSEERRVGKEGR